MEIEYNIGDFIETADGKIGYISSIRRNWQTFVYGFTMKTVDGFEYVYGETELLNLNRNFKRIGKYNFVNDNKTISSRSIGLAIDGLHRGGFDEKQSEALVDVILLLIRMCK